MTRCGVVLMLSVSAASCGPRDVIPTSPNHPANPGSPRAVASAGAPDAAIPDAEPPSSAPSASPVPDTAAIAAAEKAAYERAKPVLDEYCASCHTSSGTKKAKKKALPHFAMDRYPFGGHHADEIGQNVREVLGATGEKPTMPADRPGAVKGAELEAIIEWSKAFDAAHAAGLHDEPADEGHQH